MKAEKYKRILEKFTDIESEYRPWMKRLFNFDNKTGSTNGHILVYCDRLGEFDDMSKNVSKIIPTENKNSVIKISTIIDMVSLMPKVDCYDEIKANCDACNGSGEVEFEFNHSSKDYYVEAECPVCEGDGAIFTKSDKPNGKTETDSSFFIKIGECAFSAKNLNQIYGICKDLEVDEIKIISQSEFNQPTLFLIGDINVLLMGNVFEKEKIHSTINI